MRKVRTQARAENDLIDVWLYSFEQWGPDQADRYLDELDRGIRALARNPDLGTKRDYVREECRVLFLNSHAVYYTVTSSTVHIIRVLHGQMDPDRHL